MTPLSAVQRYTLTVEDDGITHDAYMELDPDGRYCLFDEAEDAATRAAPEVERLREALDGLVAATGDMRIGMWTGDDHRGQRVRRVDEALTAARAALGDPR